MSAVLGDVTRGTTGPNRLRRVDRWIRYALGARLRAASDPLVVDLGFGRTPVTTLELRTRLRMVRGDVRVVGLDTDPVRVARACDAADPPALTFARGGFELAGLRPVLVRAMNVLRQYDEADVVPAWDALCGALAPGGALVEGTCDELGRLASWVLLDGTGPVSLTLAAGLSTMERPAVLAQRLPKVLIQHNVPGTPVHAFLSALDRAWSAAAPLSAFGPRQRWAGAVRALQATGWPILDAGRRTRPGEVTVAWSAVRPA